MEEPMFSCNNLPGEVPEGQHHKPGCFEAMVREVEGRLCRFAATGRRRLAATTRRRGSLTMSV